MGILTRRWFQVFLLLSLLAAILALRLSDPSGVKRLRQMTFDYYNKMMPRAAGDSIVIIDIDEDSIRRHGQWPWPRTEVAKIPQMLRALGAEAVAFDVVFAEPDRTSPPLVAERLPESMDKTAADLKKLPDNDSLFAEAIAQAGNVVTAFVWSNQRTGRMPLQKAQFINAGINPDPLKFIPSWRNFATTLPVIAEAGAGSGSFSMSPENDGIIRRVPMLMRYDGPEGSAMYPSLALEALRVAEGRKVYKVTSYGTRTPQGYGITEIALGDKIIPTDAEGNLWVYYAGHRPELYIPAWKILAGEVPASRIAGKIAFIGTSAIGLLDMRSTPLNAVVPGVEVHAEIADQIRQGQFLRRPGFLDGAEIISVAAIGLFVIFVAPFVGAGTLGFLIVLATGFGFTGSLYAYREYGLLFDPVYPSLAIAVLFILSSVLTNLRTEMEKRAVRHAFSHYIAPSLMDELTDNPEKLKLGGEVREISVMFTDIRGFTSISEGMDPAELIRMMNDFLTPMTQCVLESRGTIDKYMGDAIMAFWNAPLDDADHARHACLAALSMIASLGPVNAELERRARAQGRVFHPLKAGFGINTGNASVGNMGSRQRFAYSALGDTVNLASRLEGQTKAYGVSIMVSEATRRAAGDMAFLELDLLAVKGRKELVRVFTLLGEDGGDAAFTAHAARHDAMLAAYRKGDFDAAAAMIAGLKGGLNGAMDGYYDVFAARCGAYAQNPPPQWAGVHVATEK